MIINEDKQESIKSSDDASQIFASRLSKLADEQVAKRREIEDRWIEDIRQLRGLYPEDIERKLKADETRSNAFVNLTRPKANMAKSRLWDMLFPNDDRNWSIGHTPVPELAESSSSEDPALIDEDTGDTVATVGEISSSAMDEAKSRAGKMQDEIDDQLSEGKYSEVSRDVIEDSVNVGTGIIKGPVIIGRNRRAWKKITGPDGKSVHKLEIEDVSTPVPQRVDPWNFFPDMSATRIDDCEYILERHYMTPREMLDLARTPGFDNEKIKELIVEGPSAYRTTSTRLDEMRKMAGLSSIENDSRFEVWEYHGTATKEELDACGCDDLPEELSSAVEAIIWFCGPYVIKSVLNPMETDDRPYSVFCWEEDEISVFGYGVPWQMRNPQNAANSAWRLILENGGLTFGPQIVIDDEAIEPADNSYDLRGRKVWRKTDSSVPMADAFRVFNIDSRQTELQNIYNMAQQMADIETSLPTMVQNDAAPPVNQTATGVTLWMNSANADLRRAVRNWDDNVTVKTIGRFYDWNMQFNENEDIKGDYEVDARGSSTLLVKEIQAQNLMQLSQLASNPMFAPLFKHANLLRNVVQSMQIPSDDIIKTEEDLKKEAADKKEQGAESPSKEQIDLQKAQLNYKMHTEKMAMETQKMQLDAEVASIEQETTLMKFAEEKNFDWQVLQAKLESEREKRAVDRQKFVDEVNLKMAAGSGI